MNRATNPGGTARGPHVVHVLTTLGFGGVETRMRLIARELHRRGSRVTFVAISSGGAAEDELRALGIPVIVLGRKGSVYSLDTLLAVRRTLRGLKPDIVHAHGAEANVHAILGGWLAGVPVRIGEEVGVPSHSARGRFIFRHVYRHASRVVAISPVVAEAVVALGEAPRERITIVENPVRPLNPVAVAAKERTLRIAYVGRLVDWKNIENVVTSVAALAERGQACELWIIGAGVERGSLGALAERCGIADRVRFFGYQDRPEDYVAACDLFVLPSTEREGYCMALVEAMAAGVPPVSTRVGIAPVIIEHGRTGWLVPPRDAEALAEALGEALALGREGLARVGAVAQAHVLARSTPKSYVDQLEAVYRAAGAGSA